MIKALRRLFRDVDGSAVTNLMSLASVLPVGVGLSFLTMQLFQSSHHRDMVDHVGATFADEVSKTLCSDNSAMPKGVYSGDRKAKVEDQLTRRLALITETPMKSCQMNAVPLAPSGDTAQIQTQIEVCCDVDCSFPFAAQFLCEGSPRHLHLCSKQTAVAMGCDSGN